MNTGSTELTELSKSLKIPILTTLAKLRTSRYRVMEDGSHYRCVKRTYKHIEDDREWEETLYELAELCEDGSYNSIGNAPDSENSKEDLAEWLRIAASEVNEGSIIEEDEIIVIDHRK